MRGRVRMGVKEEAEVEVDQLLVQGHVVIGTKRGPNHAHPQENDHPC